MLKNIKAAIFDLDGTLIDSMWVWEKIDIDYLAQKGLSVPQNLKDEINHLSFIQTAEYFKDRFNIDDDVETILNSWKSMAIEHYSNDVKLKPGVITFLNYLKSLGIKISLATSSNKDLLEPVLISNNILSYFDAITTTDEVLKGKNNPDVYLLAAKKLGVSPESCIVFEDILPAATGAKLANMKVIAVYDKYSEHQKDELLKIVDKYIYDYNELI